jgi:ubiquinone/menaquinone biosynthesis C-methylase UbiE
MADDELEFTGERFMPGSSDNIFLEHQHRYQMALRFAKDRAVLDIASGEGYGSILLASVARSVIGVDISQAAVTHCQKSYKRENLEFRVGSCTSIPLPDQSVDLVVSFETLEHIDAHDQMLSEIKRVLRPDGSLIISSPEKAAYTDATGLTNPFHVKELYRDEFTELMHRYFDHVTMHGQRIGFGSFIASEANSAPAFEIDSGAGVTQKGLIEPLYLIAIASDDPSKTYGITSLFSQNIMASEPVLRRVEFERTQWEEERRTELERQREALADQHRKELYHLSDAWEDWHRREVANERAVWQEDRRREIERLSEALVSLREANWHLRASPLKFFRRLIWSHVLNRLSDFKALSERRRNRFARSAAKRDPLLLAKLVEQLNGQLAAIVQDVGSQIVMPPRQVVSLAPIYRFPRLCRISITRAFCAGD